MSAPASPTSRRCDSSLFLKRRKIRRRRRKQREHHAEIQERQERY